MLHVYLGRFAPFHGGHKLLLTKLIKRFGEENCIVLIGSVNVLDDRTTFKYETREKMIHKHFPKIKILPVPDMPSDEEWFEIIAGMENHFGQKFVFYGGSYEDLKTLSQRFPTHVLVDRFTEGKGISATEIRKTLKVTDLDIDV